MFLAEQVDASMLAGAAVVLFGTGLATGTLSPSVLRRRSGPAS
jgi:hypothetical protein